METIFCVRINLEEELSLCNTNGSDWDFFDYVLLLVFELGTVQHGNLQCTICIWIYYGLSSEFLSRLWTCSVFWLVYYLNLSYTAVRFLCICRLVDDGCMNLGIGQRWNSIVWTTSLSWGCLLLSYLSAMQIYWIIGFWGRAVVLVFLFRLIPVINIGPNLLLSCMSKWIIIGIIVCTTVECAYWFCTYDWLCYWELL